MVGLSTLIKSNDSNVKIGILLFKLGIKMRGDT